MTAFNIVRFRVKPGHEQQFIDAHRGFKRPFAGFRGGALVKTGERTFCVVGEWTNFKRLADARPQMIAILEFVPRAPRGSRARPRRHRSGVRRDGAQAAGLETRGEEGGRQEQGEGGQAQEAALVITRATRRGSVSAGAAIGFFLG